MKKFYIIRSTVNQCTDAIASYVKSGGGYGTRELAEIEARKEAATSDDVWSVVEVVSSFHAQRIVSKL
jgi:hypothetical protein